MWRKKRRGEVSHIGTCFVVGLLTSLVVMAFFTFHQVCNIQSDLRRIADAVCVYAPPAEPVKDTP